MSGKKDKEERRKFKVVTAPIPQAAQTEAQRQWSQSAELNRIASLNYHTRKTLNDALEQMRQGDLDKAHAILEEAAPKYTRFGGQGPDPDWKPKTGEEQ